MGEAVAAPILPDRAACVDYADRPRFDLSVTFLRPLPAAASDPDARDLSGVFQDFTRE
jgi:hypothetical protein